MTSFLKYSGFAISLALAAYIGHYFTLKSFIVASGANKLERSQAGEAEALIKAMPEGSPNQLVPLVQGRVTGTKLPVASRPEEPALKPINHTVGPVNNEARIPPNAALKPADKNAAGKKPQVPVSKIYSTDIGAEPGDEMEGEIDEQDYGNSNVYVSDQNYEGNEANISRVATLPGAPFESSLSADYINKLIASLVSVDQGLPVDMERFKGKLLFVSVGASWCDPCLKQWKALESLQVEFGDRGLEVLAITIDEDLVEAKLVLADLALSIPMLRAADFSDTENYVFEHLGLAASPTILSFGSSGSSATQFEGFFKDRSLNVYRAYIANVLMGQKGLLVK